MCVPLVVVCISGYLPDWMAAGPRNQRDGGRERQVGVVGASKVLEFISLGL